MYLKNIQRDFQRIVDPLLASVRKELAAILAKLHRMNFSDSTDPMNAMGGGASPYMKDLVEKLNFIKSDILSQYSTPDLVRRWSVHLVLLGSLSVDQPDCDDSVIDIVKFTIKTFVLHASVAKPLGETGKLQLISDMTELEFGLSAFMADKGASKRGVTWDAIGDDYRALRAMRYAFIYLHFIYDTYSRFGQTITLLGQFTISVFEVHRRITSSHRPAPHSSSVPYFAPALLTWVGRS